MSSLIGIAGGIASGKTTVSTIILDSFEYKQISFSSALKRHCANENIPVNRENLQNLGQTLIEQLGYAGFMGWILSKTKDVVDWQKDNVLVDGFRHPEIYLAFKEVFPKAALIYCDCPENLQLLRICQRDKISLEDARKITSHASEQKVRDLKQYADFVYTPEKSVALKEWLKMTSIHGKGRPFPDFRERRDQ